MVQAQSAEIGAKALSIMTLSITTFSIMTLSIKSLIVTFSIKHSVFMPSKAFFIVILNAIRFNVDMLIVIRLNVDVLNVVAPRNLINKFLFLFSIER